MDETSRAFGGARFPMSHADAACLHLDGPTHRLVVHALLLLGGPLDLPRLTRLLEERLTRFQRLRMRVVDHRMHVPEWVEDPGFDVSRHVLQTRLPPPGDEATLLEAVGNLLSQPFDHSRPLWEVHLVEGSEVGTAVVARIHHAVGDGAALVRVLLSITDPPPPPQEVPERHRGTSGPLHEVLRALREALRLAGRALCHPVETRAAVARSASLVRAFLGLFRLPREPRSPLKGPLGIPKRAALSRDIPLSRVKPTARSVGGTVNDVMMAVVSEALRRYLSRRGFSCEGLELRVAMPVDLRPPGDARLGNRYGLLFPSLPVGVAPPLERLAEVKRRMDAQKRSPSAMAVFGVAADVGFLPSWVERWLARYFGARATAVATNVPGPSEPVRLTGRAVRSAMFWIPTTSQLGLGLCILGYAGTLRVGLACDAGVVPDPERLVEDLHAAFEDLSAAAGA